MNTNHYPKVIVRLALAFSGLPFLIGCNNLSTEQKDGVLPVVKQTKKDTQSTNRLTDKAEVVNHRIDVKYDPETNWLKVNDLVTLPQSMVGDTIVFKLHSNLKVELDSKGITLSQIETGAEGIDKGMDQEKFDSVSPVPLTAYRLAFDKSLSPDDGIKINLSYQGKINHKIKQKGEEYSRGFSQTPGIIENRGAYLSGSTYWIPSFGDEYITYSLTSSSPKGWRVVSQGKRQQSAEKGERHIDTWTVDTPTEEVYLIGAKFNEYSFDVGAVKTMAFLRTDDEALANKYLETTAQYLEMYRNLIGPYPYSKFALIENFWETGYGMPSFTLLGEQIIRFPFILHSSYPHELLHNWWGNSVYIDFSQGNWCEGLTAYMADHLIAEQRGKGAEYRRSTLQGYTDYVDEQSDFPLNEFISRHSPASSAIGYGKSAMMWDMLRERVGDDNFTKSLQRFYRNNKFKRVSFKEIRAAVEETTGTDLTNFFSQWTSRKGAPELRMNQVNVHATENTYQLKFELSQVQKEAFFAMDIPVAIFTKKGVAQKTVTMNAKQQSYTLSLKNKPLKVQIDPQFNVFRKLHYTEIPPSLSKIFGADKVLIVLPSKATSEEKKRYSRLAKIWGKQSDKFKVVTDTDIRTLPANRAVWIFGWNNLFRFVVEKELSAYGGIIASDTVTLGKTTHNRQNNSMVVSARHPANNNLVAVWLTAHDDAAVAGLARKLPHYGKYSYLAFTGTEPTNVAKGQWPTVNSPLIKILDKSFDFSQFKLPKRSALAKLAPVFSAERMKASVNFLASDEMQGRGLGSKELDKSADYIAEQFKAAGLKPAGDNNTYFQDFVTKAGKAQKKVIARNVLALIPGSNPDWSQESVIISAHYDHLGLGWPDAQQGNEGKIHNGADDNASGVAVLLELAHTLKSMKPKRNIIFAAFSAEEEGLLGAKYYVKNMQRYPAEKAIGVINMDTVGSLGENKLMILGGASAREWKFILMGTSFVTGVETEMVSQEINSSDQVAFIDAGVPGIQLFAGSSPNYHKPSDTAEKIDVSGLVKTATVAREVINYLAERSEPISFSGKSSAHKTSLSSKGKKVGRKVSTGMMPDFAFSGKGVKVSAVENGSPAAKAGLRKNDIVIKLAGVQVTDLRSYSNELKKHNVGDKVKVVFNRDGNEKRVTITLRAR